MPLFEQCKDRDVDEWDAIIEECLERCPPTPPPSRVLDSTLSPDISDDSASSLVPLLSSPSAKRQNKRRHTPYSSSSLRRPKYQPDNSFLLPVLSSIDYTRL